MRRPLTLGALGVALALVAAGCLTFSVTKETTGGEPEGPFQVQVNCDGEIDNLVFDGPFPETLESEDFVMDPSRDCTLTEVAHGNATSTTIECAEPIPAGVECTPNPDGSLQVEAEAENDDDDKLVNIIVTNDIPTTTTTAPTTPTTIDPNALAIVTSPNFTG